MVSCYFGDIQSRLTEQIENATKSIKIAMAWFTNPVLYEVLVNKANARIKCELIISNSESNFRPGYSLNFNLLKNCGATIGVMDTDKYHFMHHKFAVLDDEKVITGSFNWSNNAPKNFENIVVIDDSSTARVYSLQFQKLQTEEGFKLFGDFKVAEHVTSAQDFREADSKLFALSQEFNTDVERSMAEARRLNAEYKLGMRFEIIENLIKRYTAVGAAAYLSNRKEQSGYLKIASINKIDLTFEYLVAKSKYAPLFHHNTVNNANDKLRPYLRKAVDGL
jgi:phosphatidylserine/phosphatidylglycerophosphate/cardiolipin synthase-like enzyme